MIKDPSYRISQIGQTRCVNPINNNGVNNNDMYFKIERPTGVIYEPSIKQAIYRNFLNSNQKLMQPLIIRHLPSKVKPQPKMQGYIGYKKYQSVTRKQKQQIASQRNISETNSRGYKTGKPTNL